MNSPAARPLPCNHPVLTAGALLLALLAVAPAVPAEAADNAAVQAANLDAAESGRTGATGAEAKKHALSFGLVMLAGIILGGTMLLTLVVVWGNRTRRLARSPLPPVSKRDELWFLKPKKDSGEGPGGVSKSGPESEPEVE